MGNRDDRREGGPSAGEGGYLRIPPHCRLSAGEKWGLLPLSGRLEMLWVERRAMGCHGADTNGDRGSPGDHGRM